jgi:hypothetical protein
MQDFVIKLMLSFMQQLTIDAMQKLLNSKELSPVATGTSHRTQKQSQLETTVVLRRTRECLAVQISRWLIALWVID